jgi:hypothetical protein
MIKFYRKIRQNLLSEGKTGKYFKYAIGEIVLVVLGILIALSIKNWNENRKNNILKQTYINNLKIDLNTDTERLEGLIKFNDKYEKSGFYFLNYLENNLSEIDTIVLSRAIIYTAFIPNFTITSVTYNDLIASNNINLFKDVELKRLLDNYYIRSEWAALFNNRILKTAWYEYRDELMKYHSPLIYRDLYEISSGINSISLDNHEKYKIDWSGIQTNKYLRKQVEMILAYRIQIRSRLGDDIKNVKLILKYLESNK